MKKGASWTYDTPSSLYIFNEVLLTLHFFI